MGHKLIIKIKVFPGVGREEVIDLGDKNYKIYLKEKAEKGKANISLIKILSKKFKVNYKDIKIKVPKGRNKIVEINI